MKNVVIVRSLRTPFLKINSEFKNIPAYDLGATVVKELVKRSELDTQNIDEVIIGNVAQPPEAANLARHIALLADLPHRIPAVTVQRNCASGMEAIAYAYQKIQADMGNTFIVGGAENMSQIPLMWNAGARNWLQKFMRCRGKWQQYRMLAKFKMNYYRPVIGLKLILSDRSCGLEMGHTAEILAHDFSISREEQDLFSLRSHQRAKKAIDDGKFTSEIMPYLVDEDDEDSYISQDNGVRELENTDKLAKLKTVFKKESGTVTAGNASQITDGAAMLLVMEEEHAKKMGYKPVARIRSFAFAGLDPSYMGLGPAYATPLALDKAKMTMKDVDLVEINEAFAVQVLANLRIFSCNKLSEKYLKRPALGELDETIVNVNGGAIALGHPVGASAVRIVMNLVNELERQDKSVGLATLCVGGGQGASFVVEKI
ncbi:thiolase family protein [Candidatus Uabimicrobium sp. HlEnr_7]|uniref:thiolase family protein n=1 Tax=Candidatus Uabimicrobium helgolandensis TaxID=3095367 RepID=UPI0035579ED3